MKYCLYCVFFLNFVYLCLLILLFLCKKLLLKVYVIKLNFVLFVFFKYYLNKLFKRINERFKIICIYFLNIRNFNRNMCICIIIF